ncbi:MAG TPA: hypothetical protein VN831_26150, partial [Bradyrhizobium sp.]|nr:hypothetical protein [Bradyrhizobium sp.]
MGFHRSGVLLPAGLDQVGAASCDAWHRGGRRRSSPWGDRIEIVLRELGGFMWIQITVLIIFIRVVFSSIATGWRYR